MKIGPKYKIARRLGAPIFEKTQTQKYALSLTRKERSDKKGYAKPKSEYGRALIEKQKARYTYGVGERQFKKYVLKALKSADPVQKLLATLESRLDNVAFRAGLVKTRPQARQAASHGHLLVNNVRVTVPSILLFKGDIVAIRVGSATSPLFGEVEERMKTLSIPSWLKVDPAKKIAVVEGEPVYVEKESIFNLGTVIEFYNR